MIPPEADECKNCGGAVRDYSLAEERELKAKAAGLKPGDTEPPAATAEETAAPPSEGEDAPPLPPGGDTTPAPPGLPSGREITGPPSPGPAPAVPETKGSAGAIPDNIKPGNLVQCTNCGAQVHWNAAHGSKCQLCQKGSWVRPETSKK